MKRQTPVYHFVEDFLRGGLSYRAVSKTMNHFKNNLDYQELMISLQEIMKINPRFKQLMWGYLFPRNYHELGVGNNYYYRSSGAYFELNWILVQVAKHREQIGEFVAARDLVFRYMTLSDYERVGYEISNLEERLGVSVWSTEMRLMCNSLAGCENKSFELLGRVNRAADEVSEKGKTGYVPLLAHYLFKRSSSQSAISFEDELNAINKHSRNDFQEDRMKYYQFRLNYYSAPDHNKLESILIYETANSLIDKYMSLLNLLKWLFSGTDAERVLAVECASKLYRYVPDADLLPFFAYAFPERLPKQYFDKDFVQILDLYYCRDYDGAIQLCKLYLSKNPNHFDCIRIYVQSLIFLGHDFSPVIGESVVDRIAYFVYQSLYESDNTLALAGLYDYNKRIYGLPIAAGVHSFILEQQKNNVDNCVKCLSLKSFDPFFTRVWSDENKDSAIDYLKRGKDYIVNSIAIDYHMSRLTNDADDKVMNQVAPYIRKRDEARINYANKDYGQCISECDALFADWGKYLSIGQFSSEYAFRSYVERGERMSAISFYLNRYLDKKALVNGIQTESFMETLRRERYKKGIRNTIDFQVFVFLNAKEDEQKAHVLQLYMNNNNASDMETLIQAIKDDASQEKLEIFLYSLVEGDILRHLPYIGSTKQMLEEQQVVVQFLSQLDSPYHELYEESNKQILQLMISYENTKKLDESRIYVNEAAIIKYESTDCESLYHQLASRDEAVKSLPDVYILQTSADGAKSDLDNQIMQTAFKATRNVSTDITTRIFNMVCQKYLFSKFGLKTYLSTRIRHGVLEGEIRRVFDTSHLMLTTQNNRFTPINYWSNAFGLSWAEQDSLMQKLERFSSRLGRIIDDFKSNVVQIKVKEEDLGMFDYTMPDERKSYSVILAQNLSADFEGFYSNILLFLDQVTEQSLIRIRAYVRDDLHNQFIDLIDHLERDVQEFSSCHFYEALLGAISLSRENIQGTLYKIEKWFSLQTGVYNDFNLKDQMLLVWNVTVRQYPNIKYKCSGSTDDADLILDASHYMDIADMLTIFYNNMFGHAREENQRRYVISAKREGDSVVLHFENATSESDETFNGIIAELLKSESRLQTEGRSGLAKVKKIVQDDLGGKEEDLSVIAENGICKVDVRLRLNNLLKK